MPYPIKANKILHLMVKQLLLYHAIYKNQDRYPLLNVPKSECQYCNKF